MNLGLLKTSAKVTEWICRLLALVGLGHGWCRLIWVLGSRVFCARTSLQKGIAIAMRLSVDRGPPLACLDEGNCAWPYQSDIHVEPSERSMLDVLASMPVIGVGCARQQNDFSFSKHLAVPLSAR